MKQRNTYAATGKREKENQTGGLVEGKLRISPE